MKKHALSDGITYFFILLFLYTGVIKLWDVGAFSQQLSSSPLLGSTAGIIAWALPVIELFNAVLLIVPKWRIKGLYSSLALMALCTVYVITILLMDPQLACNCGGIIAELSPKQHLIFNSASLILGVLAIFSLRGTRPALKLNGLAGSFSILLLGTVGWLLFSAFTAPPVHKTGLEGRLLPPMDLRLIDSATHLNTGDIPTGKPIIVIGFNPWCTHCQSQTRDILRHIKDFNDMRIYYITPWAFRDMKIFYRHYQLQRYPNIIVGRDSTNDYFHYFKADFTPLTAIYDAKKRLKTVLPGELTAAQLIQSVKN